MGKIVDKPDGMDFRKYLAAHAQIYEELDCLLACWPACGACAAGCYCWGVRLGWSSGRTPRPQTAQLRCCAAAALMAAAVSHLHMQVILCIKITAAVSHLHMQVILSIKITAANRGEP